MIYIYAVQFKKYNIYISVGIKHLKEYCCHEFDLNTVKKVRSIAVPNMQILSHYCAKSTDIIGEIEYQSISLEKQS
ncbi:hypothetical protein TSPI_00397 [Trichinella spiralis]|uniref:Uncharacterized protein n=1 Tax=Trichinella spiralis TaxID=6334 RepID=A0ABR3KAN1_TRISP